MRPKEKKSGHILRRGVDIKGCKSSACLARIVRKARDMNEDSEGANCKRWTYGSQGLGSQLVMRLSCSSQKSAAAGPVGPTLSSSNAFKNMSTSISYGHLTYYDGPLVWIDCEMTGLDYETDRILEIAVSALSLTSGPSSTYISWDYR